LKHYAPLSTWRYLDRFQAISKNELRRFYLSLSRDELVVKKTGQTSEKETQERIKIDEFIPKAVPGHCLRDEDEP
jgi:hypothetical protein